MCIRDRYVVDGAFGLVISGLQSINLRICHCPIWMKGKCVDVINGLLHTFGHFTLVSCGHVNFRLIHQLLLQRWLEVDYILLDLVRVLTGVRLTPVEWIVFTSFRRAVQADSTIVRSCRCEAKNLRSSWFAQALLSKHFARAFATNVVARACGPGARMLFLHNSSFGGILRT